MSPKRPHDGESPLASSALAKKAVRMGALLGAVGGGVRADVAHAADLNYELNPLTLEEQYDVDLTSMVGGDQYRVWGVAGDLAEPSSPLAISVDIANTGLPDTVELTSDRSAWTDVTSDFEITGAPAVSSYSPTQDRVLALDFGGGGYNSVEGYGKTGAKTSLTTYDGPSTIGAIDDSTGDVYGSGYYKSELKPYLFTESGQTYLPEFDLPEYEEEGFTYNSETKIGAFTDHKTNEVIVVDYSGSEPVAHPTGVTGWVSDPQPGSFKVVLDSDYSWHELRDPTFGDTPEDTGGTDTGVVDTGVTDTGDTGDSGDTGATDTGVEDTGVEDTGATDTGDTGSTGETADTADSAADTGDTGDTSDTGETGDSAVDTGETADSGADTGDTGVVVETGDTQDTSDTGDTSDTEDTQDSALADCTDILPDGPGVDEHRPILEGEETVACTSDGQTKFTLAGPAEIASGEGYTDITIEAGATFEATVGADGDYRLTILYPTVTDGEEGQGPVEGGTELALDAGDKVDGSAGVDLVAAVKGDLNDCTDDLRQAGLTDTTDSRKWLNVSVAQGEVLGGGILDLDSIPLSQGNTYSLADTQYCDPTTKDTGIDTGNDTGVVDTGDTQTTETGDTGDSDTGPSSHRETGVNSDDPKGCGCAYSTDSGVSFAAVGGLMAVAAMRRRK